MSRFHRFHPCITYSVALVVICSIASCKKERDPFALQASFLYDEMMASMTTTPGFGFDSFDGTAKDRPMAYALILSAEANRHKHTNNADALARVQLCGNWLLENNDLDNDGLVGYGLADSWDAFDDGTTNPVHHEYTITTGICVNALLDWYEVTSETQTQLAIENTVNTCLEVYLDNTFDSTIGIPGYSLSDVDLGYDVFNPAMYLVQPLFRAAALFESTELYADRGAQIISSSLAFVQTDCNGLSFFNYRAGVDRPNDLVHELYCLEGLQTFKTYHDPGFTLLSFEQHRMAFLNDNTWYEFSDPSKQNEDLNCRLWALGMAIYSFSKDQRFELVEETLLPQITRYYKGNGQFMFKENDPRNLIRHNAHVALGLSYYLYH